ncbi:MAG: carbamoyltransferase C-terminal domain-containing protein [Bacteroidales bacterium]
MRKDKPTLAIYGIQDIDDKPYPSWVHDHNITLAENEEIIKFCQLERITRKKYDHRMPDFLYDLLKDERLLSHDDYDVVFVDNVIGRSFINTRGNLRFEAPLTEKPLLYPESGRLFWLDNHRNGYVVNHELAHVFSNMPFYGEFKNNSLHVHFDGGARSSNFSAWLFKDGSMHLIEYNWDLKLLSSFFNSNALTFSIIGATKKDQNGMAGKFMGFSAYGSYDERIEEWLRRNNYFENIWGNKTHFFTKVKNDWSINLSNFDLNNEFIRNVAATFQHIFEKELIAKLNTLKTRTGADSLYYTGGSALNIKANGKILSSGLFDELYIPPCTNDSGLSLGAATFIEWLKHGKVKKHSPYLNNWSLGNNITEYTVENLEQIIELLASEEIIGVCNGFGEAGPRALGNRSIIARADSHELAQFVSQKLKNREWYRPVAPVILEKNLEYFVGNPVYSELSKYMLLDFPVRQSKIQEMAGCVHVDGTSRIQTIKNRHDIPFMHDLLTLLEERKGIKALLNTSFNTRGKSIVHNEKDAIEDAKIMGLNYLILNGRLITL